ncbi:DNA damage-inducible transcript 4-like protein [Glandiceps talaboti]
MTGPTDTRTMLGSAGNANSQSLDVADSWRRIIEKIAEMILGPPKPIYRTSVIETAELGKVGLKSEENKNSYGTFEDPEEKETCQALSKRIFEALRNAKDKLDCEVLIPFDLTLRIAQDMLRMSKLEPCGIRGSTIFITMQDGGLTRKLGKVVVDPCTITTFEMYLELSRVSHSIFNISFPTCFQLSKHDSIRVSPGFKLVKNKLYRSHHLQEE